MSEFLVLSQSIEISQRHKSQLRSIKTIVSSGWGTRKCISVILSASLTKSTFVKLRSWYLEKRSNSKGSVVEISKIQSVCLDKNGEDRLLYLMMGPRLPVFCDHWLCVVHFGEFMMV